MVISLSLLRWHVWAASWWSSVGGAGSLLFNVLSMARISSVGDAEALAGGGKRASRSRMC